MPIRKNLDRRLNRAQFSGIFHGIPLLLFLAGALAFGQKKHLRFNTISLDQGLSQVSIMCILQDRKGFMWFGTQDGLNRYDGYDFVVYKNYPENPNSLSDNLIKAMVEDPRGLLWVGAYRGLNLFDPKKDQFRRFLPDPNNPNSLAHAEVTALLIDAQARLWVGSNGGGLQLFDWETMGFHAIPSEGSTPENLDRNKITALLESESGTLWVGSMGGLLRLDDASRQLRPFPIDVGQTGPLHITVLHPGQNGLLWVGTYNEGLIRLDPQTQRTEHFRFAGSDPDTLQREIIRCIFTGNDGLVWIGSDGDGLNLFDPRDRSSTIYHNNQGDPFSLPHEVVRDIYQDRTGVIWIGTFGGGIARYDPNSGFEHYAHDPADPGSLSQNGIASVLQDHEGVLWVGTWDEGLNRLDPGSEHFRHYRYDPANANSLSTNQGIVPIYQDRFDNLWIGNQQGLARFVRETEQFEHFRNDPANPNSLNREMLTAIFEDAAGRFWLGSRGGGLTLFDRVGHIFTHYRKENGLSDNDIRALAGDGDQGLWIGTFGGGLNRFDPDANQFRHFRHDDDAPSSLSNDRILCIYNDPNASTVWIGTWGGGLNRFEPASGIFQSYRERDGLPNSVVYGILSDEHGHLWMSTNKGLARFDPETERFRGYDVNDGLQSKEYNQSAFFRAEDGKMFFGGVNGLNAFYPEKILDDPHPPKTVISRFLLFREPAPLQREDPESPLEFPIHETKSLTLDYKNYAFSFEFAALHYADPERNKYAYMMEGLDKEWIVTDARKRFAGYTKLPSGDYTFKVRAANKDGVWGNEIAAVELSILAPPWRTWWAYVLYALATAGLIAVYWRAHLRKIARDYELEKERLTVQKEHLVVEHLQRLNQLKDEFLANTSHELRTPLNGIIGLAESMADGAVDQLPEPAVANLNMIADSGKRLASLVNDILDFSRLKHGGLELKHTPVELRGLTDVVFNLSRSLIGGKDLKLINAVHPGLPYLRADVNRVQQIMLNLVGNAIKFTESGRVAVSARAGDEFLTILVADTGIGIPKEQWDLIFESFEQVDGSSARSYGGTGLGLAITRKLVQLHGGEIWLESTPGKGATFFFKLPIWTGEAPVSEPTSQAVTSLMTAPVEAPDPLAPVEIIEPPPGEYRILVVDDEPVNRQVLVNHLSPWGCRIMTASGGKEALAVIAREGPPDLVLLDIMMPVVSGYEVCRELRQSYSAHQLPIIFLTAKNQISDLMLGFSAGANDYITKPISRHELLSRVKTHLQLLDVNRTLERKIQERSLALEQRNKEVIRRQKQLVVQEKMASLGTLTAGIAHEIKNPLNFINNFAFLSSELFQELEDTLLPKFDQLDKQTLAQLHELLSDLRKNTAVITQQGQRANQIVQSMMEIAGGEPGQRQAINFNGLIDEFASLAYRGMQAKNPGVQVIFLKDLDVSIEKMEVVSRSLNRVIVNVVNNALEAVLAKQEQGRDDYEPTISIKTQNHGSHVEVRVWDNGVGIPRDHLNQIYNPFFTTKPTGSGHIGLGLTISYEIVVQEHQGGLTVKSVAGEHTECRITLPRTAKESDASGTAA